MIGKLFALFKWTMIVVVTLVVLFLLPVGYVETFCRQDAKQNAYQPIIADAKYVRAQANSYLTYPQWHIVYAYEGLAKILETDDEYAFDYLDSIGGFWRSFCKLNQTANVHGGGDFNTRSTVHIIGVSFTLEMVMKALYEETIGRMFALLRGSEKSPQDIYAAHMAGEYARFMQQVAWHEFDFQHATTQLWREPMPSLLRGWERRLALGGEWQAKSAYAPVIARALQAPGQTPLRIRSVIKGLSGAQLQSIAELTIVEETSDYIIVETPRYRKFTHIVEKLIIMGGVIVETAGNDEIMLSATGNFNEVRQSFKNGEILSRISRDGYNSERFLINVKLQNLGTVLGELASAGLALEHIYDY